MSKAHISLNSPAIPCSKQHVTLSLLAFFFIRSMTCVKWRWKWIDGKLYELSADWSTASCVQISMQLQPQNANKVHEKRPRDLNKYAYKYEHPTWVRFLFILTHIPVSADFSVLQKIVNILWNRERSRGCDKESCEKAWKANNERDIFCDISNTHFAPGFDRFTPTVVSAKVRYDFDEQKINFNYCFALDWLRHVRGRNFNH